MASLLRLTELYGDKYQRLLPSIRLGDQTITTTTINEAFVDTLPVFSRTDKSWILSSTNIKDDEFNFAVTDVPINRTTIQVEFSRLVAHKWIKFYNHDAAKSLVPRMLINIEDRNIQPGQCVFINTGYTIKSAHGNEANFVLLPNIVCKSSDGKKCKIIPNIYARDEDDSGLFTVSFTLLEGVPAKIQIVFNCYLVGKIADNCVELHNQEPNNEIFKPKDMKAERATKNLKIKTHFESMERHSSADKAAGDFVEFKTYNHLVSPPMTWPEQTLRIHKRMALVTSRRREWAQDDLITLSGCIINAANDRVPKIFTKDNNTPNKNTHCLTLITSRAVLESKVVGINDYRGLSIVNGAFSGITGDFGKLQKHTKLMNDYSEKIHSHKKIISILTKLPEGVAFGDCIKACNMLRVYDVTQSLDVSSVPDNQLLNDDELLRSLNIKITKNTQTLSSALVYSMYWLISNLLTGQLSSLGLSELRDKIPSAAAKVSETTNKRKIDESFADTPPQPPTKKNKT